MYSAVILILTVAFALSTLVLVSVNREIRKILKPYLYIQRCDQRSSTAPPSPLALEQRAIEKAIDYSDVFPPSRRAALLDVYDKLPEKHLLRTTPRSIIAEIRSLRKGLLVPLDASPEHRTGHQVTPTGISVEEIRQLGDFPDYATLCGIPPPEAAANFSIERAVARPYRPFRWSYHQTMSLTKMESNWWLELTKDYESVIQQRLDLYAKNGPLVLQYLSGSDIACKELMEMVLQFLCHRYPECFHLHEPGHRSRSRPVGSEYWTFENKILKTSTVLNGAQHPLITILHHVPEDFAVMLRDPETGLYHLRAGVICSALGWSLGNKMGMKLNEVHSPVPDYAEKMQFSMDRYFAKKPTDRAIQRGSWGLEIDTPLFMPPGDPHEAHREYQMAESKLSLSRVHLRVDWQTLRRLPLSGAVIFNFKGLFTPIEELRDEPYVPKLLLKILNEGKENIMKYKNCWHVEHVAKPALERWVKEQEEKGFVERDWTERTLEESPFYPGWKEKWRGSL